MPDERDPRPFRGAHRALLVLPARPASHPDHDALTLLTTLLVRELPELEAEVGCPVEPVAPRAIRPGIPAILIGPADANPALAAWRRERALPDGPLVAIDREGGRVVVDADDLSGIGEAMQLLRTAVTERRDLLQPSLCETVGEVLDRLDTEVRRTFPLLAERAPGWERAVAWARAEMGDADDLPALQRLMATLDDAHSWAKPAAPTGRLPYHLHDDGTTTRFWDVPPGTAAWEQCVRPGDIALLPETAPWWPRTGSVARTKPWNVGYRALQGPVGADRKLAAVRADGSEVRWREPIPALPWPDAITIDRLDAATGYLRIRGWLNGAAWSEAFTAALAEMRRYERLVVDLRGNVGGALVAAQDARDRFLPERTMLGSIRFSTVTDELDAPHPLIGEPPAAGPRWTKPVRFLVDPLCYSATEDFLLGLQGLPHVQLVGQTTGGGSGRPRTVRLRPGSVATISTALTYDRNGRCVEGNGLAPEIAVEPDPRHPDAVIERVMRTW